jgi:hypothetical protein
MPHVIERSVRLQLMSETFIRDIEKAEWPPMKSAVHEAEPGPDEKFDFNAKPHTYYLEAEGTGAIPVNDVVVHVSWSNADDRYSRSVSECHLALTGV